MKRFLIYIVLFVVGLCSSCKKEDGPVFDDPDTRLAAALAEDQAQLLSAANGWFATIYPIGGKGFSFYFKFTADGKVSMLSDFNATSSDVIVESTYRLKGLQRPSLIFDSYNYIHLPADPNSAVSGGTNAVGLKSDFEFAFEGLVKDTLKMEGLYNANVMIMVKATAAEEQSLKAGGLKTMVEATNTFLTVNKFPYFQFSDGLKNPFILTVATKSAVFTSLNDKGERVNQNVKFAFTTKGVIFNNPIRYGNNVFKELFWDATNKQFFVNINGTRVNLLNSGVPLDPLAPIFGPGKDYSQIEYNPAVVSPSLSADFAAKYNQAKTNLTTSNRVLTKMVTIFNVDNTMTMTLTYVSSGTSTFTSLTFDTVKDVNGNIKITYKSGGNSTVVAAIKPITDFFEGNQFKVDWVVNPGTGASYGGLYNITTPTSFYYGTLIK